MPPKLESTQQVAAILNAFDDSAEVEDLEAFHEGEPFLQGGHAEEWEEWLDWAD